jgi:hypothetical protein
VGRIPSCGGGVAPARGTVTGQVPGARNDGVAVGTGDNVDGGPADEQLEPDKAARRAMLSATSQRRRCDTGQA